MATSALSRTSVALLATTATDEAGARALPHESQNFAPERFAVPHDGHFKANCAPHPAQNFAVSRLSAPQFAQRICPRPYALNSSSKALASLRSVVSKRSLNQRYIPASLVRPWSRCPCFASNRVRLVVARSSHDFAACSCAISIARSKQLRGSALSDSTIPDAPRGLVFAVPLRSA